MLKSNHSDSAPLELFRISMKNDRVIWIVVALLTSATGPAPANTRHGLSHDTPIVQTKPTPPTEPWSSKRFATVDYESKESLEPAEKERRKLINQRYDKQEWVRTNPHPETGMVGRVIEDEPPPTIPAKESHLIISGRVVKVSTHLSNDKTGVYSEYRIKVDKVFKRGGSIDLEAGGFITVDRAGGKVRYPNGQTVIYLDSVKGLPEVGLEYVMFLTDDKYSNNYPILTLYELHETKTVPMDSGRNTDEIKRKGKTDFIKAIQENLLPVKDKDAPRKQDFTKCPLVDVDAPEPSDAVEREKKREKDKRYDKAPFVILNPRPEFTWSTLYDAEPVPESAFPFKQSKLVITGVILGSKALMSSNKGAVYSEYTVQIESILSHDKGRELQIGQLIEVDRAGGRVRYPNGAIIRYRNSWQDMPEPNERYLFFLDTEDRKNPNYKLITAYKLKDEGVSALDRRATFQEYNGRKKSEFMKLVLDAAKGQ
jgi:hypothetical protein